MLINSVLMDLVDLNFQHLQGVTKMDSWFFSVKSHNDCIFFNTMPIIILLF